MIYSILVSEIGRHGGWKDSQEEGKDGEKGI